jgi:hypothetical protein
MNAPEKEPTQTTTGSEARRHTIAVISAWACLGVAVIVAVIVAALVFLS